MTLNTANIRKYMESQIPKFAISAWTMVSHYALDKCNNSSKFTVPICFGVLLVLTAIWESFYAQEDYHNKNSKRISLCCYIITKVSSALLAFIAYSYFCYNGSPFNCLFGYSSELANILFYLSFAVIATIAYVEKNYIDNDPKQPMLNMTDHHI